MGIELDGFRAKLQTENVFYPIVEVRSLDPDTMEEHLIGPCCFHDILNADGIDLSGMGLTILGNMIQGLKNKSLNPRHRYRISLQMNPDDDPIPLSWPGMPDDRPLPLDVEKLPLDYTMFLDKSECKFMRRVDRQKLMVRISQIWVPHLIKLMKKKGSFN